MLNFWSLITRVSDISILIEIVTFETTSRFLIKSSEMKFIACRNQTKPNSLICNNQVLLLWFTFCICL